MEQRGQKYIWLSLIAIVALLVIGGIVSAKRTISPQITSPNPEQSQETLPPSTPQPSASQDVLALADYLHPGMQQPDVSAAIGKPDRIEKELDQGSEEETWFYQRGDGILKIHFTQWQGLDSYKTY